MYDPLRAKAKVALYGGLTFFLGLGIASGLGWTRASLAMPVVDETPALTAEAIQPAADLSEAFVNIADVVTPAVVRIESRRPARVASREGQGQNMFRFFSPEGGQNQPPEPELAGGSGFIATADGYILTNDHVVSGADRVTVYLRDRRYFEARVIGTDPFTDVAVIKIDIPEQLPHLSFGDSEGVKVGQWVLAVGNPGFGTGSQLDYTVTAGIVSARGRGLNILQRELQQQYGGSTDPETQRLPAYAIEDFIQTDAVINPGNSGGPMVNLLGQVVGINSAIATNTGFYQGYGFAIPVNLARRVMEDLVEYGVVKRPMIGVQMQTVTPEDAEVYGLPSVEGALVQGLTKDSPAEAAGVRSGDVIVAVDGKKVGYSQQLQSRIAEHRPGDRVTLTVYRDKRSRELEVRLGEAPISALTPRAVESTSTADERIGIRVEAIDAETARDSGFKPGDVVITDVQRGSVADQKGFGPGLKVVQIDGKAVRTPEDVRQVLADVKAGQVISFVLETAPREVDGRAVAGNRQIVNVRMPTH
jgi:serine protease Do